MLTQTIDVTKQDGTTARHGVHCRQAEIHRSTETTTIRAVTPCSSPQIKINLILIYLIYNALQRGICQAEGKVLLADNFR
jgi:hypothetical protein